MRLQDQLRFTLEIDKLKSVLRQTLLVDGSRKENSAEHSWHIGIMATTFLEYANGPIDVARVQKMLLLHDVIEVDAGDTYAYDPEGIATREARERAAADRIFGMLPQDQAAEFRALWDEFEAQKTKDSLYANALDRLQPLLLNFHSGGKTWMEHGISSAQVYERMELVRRGTPELWSVVVEIVETAVQNGWLRQPDVREGMWP